jgi:hypothetical protein
MSTTTTNTGLTRPAVPRKSGQRGRNVAGRRAVIVDGSLQAGDASKAGLKISPSFSPAYLLAALEWAEDGENSNIDDSDIGSAGCSKPPVRPAALAQKTAASTNLRPRRANDDVNKLPRGRPGPTAPRMDLLSEKLVFPSRRTPASFLPTPSSISLDTAAAAKPAFSPSPISPGGQSLHRENHRQRQHQQPQQHRNVGEWPGR